MTGRTSVPVAARLTYLAPAIQPLSRGAELTISSPKLGYSA